MTKINQIAVSLDHVFYYLNILFLLSVLVGTVLLSLFWGICFLGIDSQCVYKYLLVLLAGNMLPKQLAFLANIMSFENYIVENVSFSVSII